MEINNTLVLGNGFSRALFKDMPSWKSLFGKVESDINNYTMLYEVNLLNGENKTDNEVKQELMRIIQNAHFVENIKENVTLELNKFGEYLSRNGVQNIITTNYDEGIEFILCNKCGYINIETEGMIAEKIYSIRTYKMFNNKENGHCVKLWKIHGDINRIETVTLGFDQYCGSLSKLSEYIKGKYASDKGPKCSVSMIDKCKTQEFDNLSWAELFFNTNVYIVGLGMDFSEIDIWWLLNKHIRIQNEISNVQNKIFYLYNNKYDNKEKKKDIFEALEAFQVECHGIDSDKNYIKSIFDIMKDTKFQA